METKHIHVFESAGLGVGPFKFVRVEIRRFRPHPSAWAKPGGSCKYCGTAITECCVIRDSQGHEFIVGNECVKKTGDSGLYNPIKRELNRLRRDEKAKRTAERVRATFETIKQDTVADALSSEPHPHPHFASQGKTKLDWVTWMLDRGGDKGRTEACKVVESVSDFARRK